MPNYPLFESISVAPVGAATKLFARTGCLESQFGIVLTKFMVLFRYGNLQLSVKLWAFLSYGNLSLLSENFKLVSQQNVKTISLSDQPVQGRVLEVSAWRVRG
jgi:hypothetical protein